MTNVLVVMGSSDLRTTIKAALQRPGICFQGAYSSCAEMPVDIETSRDLLILIDLDERKPNGLHALPYLRQKHAQARIIGLTLENPDGYAVVDGLQAGDLQTGGLHIASLQASGFHFEVMRKQDFFDAAVQLFRI